MKRLIATPLLAAMTSTSIVATPGPAPVEFRVAAVADRVVLIEPAEVELRGWLGDRVEKNARNRLAQVDLEPLLAGYRTKPGTHPWIGEHIGKWMHAATLAWVDTGDPRLLEKLQYASAELVKAQEPDGYLGTYLPENRFKLEPGNDWDVWSHKYCLMGLLTYYRYTGDGPSLEASRKAGDLLLSTFGPGRKSILSAGTHVGMAATSVLEPMVLLYRHTGDERYLDFSKYIVSSWREPGGPRIIESLMDHGQVNKTANSKGYEMLSNLVGLCELCRVTGDRTLLEPAVRAWEDIVTKRLYLTGSATQGEHFGPDHYLPNTAGAHIGETCVTTTWIQLNSQLLRLTGEARYGEELERTFYNHLAAAQRPDGAQWCYFTPLEGRKPYGPGINCCVSSGPRGMALVPPHTICTAGEQGNDVLFINLLEDAQASVRIAGTTVKIEQDVIPVRTDRLEMKIVLKTAGKARFSLAVRQPRWAENMRAVRPGLRVQAAEDGGWWRVRERVWKSGDTLVLHIEMRDPLITGTHLNTGLAALGWGPFILAYDDSLNPGEPGVSAGLAQPVDLKRTGPARFEAIVRSRFRPEPHRATFTTFADAGATGGRFRVWLQAPGTGLPAISSIAAGEDRSREGNVEGSIIDGDKSTFVVTFDTTRRKEDWFSVELALAQEVRGVEFSHGKEFHDGGWFDASAGKPKVQIQREPGGEWETVAELSSYPDTTATDLRGLTPGQTFTVQFPRPEKAVAIRVLGKPASGDNTAQAFSSCAELKPLLK